MGIKLFRPSLLVLFLSILPSAVSAQLVEVSSAQWAEA